MHSGSTLRYDHHAVVCYQVSVSSLQAADAHDVLLEELAALVCADFVVVPHRHVDGCRLSEQLSACCEVYDSELNSEAAFSNDTGAGCSGIERDLIDRLLVSAADLAECDQISLWNVRAIVRR